MYKKIFFILIISISSVPAQDRQYESNILTDFFKISKDSQSDYPLKDIMQGCPAVDCIPAIDKPEFMPADKVEFLADNDLILAVTIDNITRVYPAMTLQMHEIVNDQIGDVPFAVTYCPLCGTGVVFSRKVKNEVVTFGVSGVLHGSDLVMYDRKNHNLWQQLTGKAFAGPDRGYKLKNLPLIMTDWKSWKNQHPDSFVLANSKDKASDRYKGYRESDKVMFGGVTDPRLNPKRVVYGINLGGQAVAIDFEMIKNKKDFILKADHSELKIQYFTDGTISIKNNSTGKAYQTRRSYWFAWFTFNPKTLLFK